MNTPPIQPGLFAFEDPASIPAAAPNVFRVRIHGYPVAWMRPRAKKVGAFVRFFTHPDQEDWKRTVQAQVIQVKPAVPFQRACAARMVFHLVRPVSLAKKVTRHEKKPDLENCAKAVLDFLSGLVYRDDAQVDELHLRKIYSQEPGVEIEIMEAAT